MHWRSDAICWHAGCRLAARAMEAARRAPIIGAVTGRIAAVVWSTALDDGVAMVWLPHATVAPDDSCREADGASGPGRSIRTRRLVAAAGANWLADGCRQTRADQVVPARTIGRARPARQPQNAQRLSPGSNGGGRHHEPANTRHFRRGSVAPGHHQAAPSACSSADATPACEHHDDDQAAQKKLSRRRSAWRRPPPAAQR